eukprot:4804235-Amphidinium_carterae.1
MQCVMLLPSLHKCSTIHITIIDHVWGRAESLKGVQQPTALDDFSPTPTIYQWPAYDLLLPAYDLP